MALAVIGAGFGRTGTNSLRRALEHLGFGPCHHMYEVRDNAEQLPLWEAALEGAADWDTIFAGYRSQVDWPGAAYWRVLTQVYPDAKVILSTRDPVAWHRSVAKTILPLLATRGQRETPYLNRLSTHNRRLIDLGLFDGKLSDPAHAIAVFKAHLAQVQATVPPERLLTFDVAEGWAPLCAFLQVPTPEDPFPMTNTVAAFQAGAGEGI